MKFMFIIISFFFLSSCSEKIDTRTPEQKRKDQCEMAENRTTFIFAKKMMQKKGLVTVGVGGAGSGIPGKGARMLSITFECYQEVDISQARKLLLECVQEFLNEINTTEELESCLSVFPFTYKNVSLRFLFTDKPTGNFVKPPSLAVARANEGKLSYLIDRDDNLEDVGEETYEEALKIVNQE